YSLPTRRSSDLTFYRIILGTIHGSTCLLFDPIISSNTMDRRHTAGIHRTMPDSRESWNIIDHGILTRKTIAKQAFEAVISISVCKPVQIIPTHLVYHQSYH